MTDLGDWGTALVAVFLVASSAGIWALSRRQVVDASNVNEVDELSKRGHHRDRRRRPAAPSVALSEGLTATIPSPPVVATSDPTTPATPPTAAV